MMNTYAEKKYVYYQSDFYFSISWVVSGGCQGIVNQLSECKRYNSQSSRR